MPVRLAFCMLHLLLYSVWIMIVLHVDCTYFQFENTQQYVIATKMTKVIVIGQFNIAPA